MTEQEKNELIYGSKLKVTLTQKEWRAVLSAVFNASVQMRGYGKIYDKIAKQTNEQVEKILQKNEQKHIAGHIDEDDRLFKFLMKCKRNANKPDLHSFKVETKKGTAFVECRDEEVRIDLYLGNEKKIFVLTYIAAANKLDQLGADMNTVEM